MANDMEALARALMSAKQGPQLARGLEKLSALSGTPEGQELLQLLAGGGADTVKAAATAALAGDKDAAKKAIMTLFSTKNGAALAVKLMELLGQ